MKLNRNSWLARIYFWGHGYIADGVNPEAVTLCDLVSYVFVGLPLTLLVMGMFSPIWVPLWVGATLADWWSRRKARRRQWHFEEPRTVDRHGSLHALGAYLLAKKRRICPLIEWR